MLEFILVLISIPVVIAIAVGVVCCVIVGVACYYAGRYRHRQETREQAELKAELITHEHAIRQSAGQLAQQTAKDIQQLKTRTAAQQKHIETHAIRLANTVDDLNTTTEQIDETSTQFNTANESAQEEITHLTQELLQLRSEMLKLNQELVCSLNTTQPTGDIEIRHLQDENIRLTATVTRLETLVNRFSVEFKNLSTLNQQQLSEINALHQENRQLTDAIRRLVHPIENNDNPRPSPTASPHRLFNP